MTVSRQNLRVALLVTATLVLGGMLPVIVHRPDIAGAAGWSVWIAAAVLWALATGSVHDLAALTPRSELMRRAASFSVPLLFGALVLVLGEVVTTGAGIPSVLVPSPSSVVLRFLGSGTVLRSDLVQTFLKSALPGYGIGCSIGFLLAIVCDRSAFLRRGLLPIGTLTSALPIVGIAPIMVMWFGFDWPSKAAVVAVMTVFPMLVNTDAGLAAAGRFERDLMRSYAAGYSATLIKLRLPAALPFIFNGLKVNATLALIGAIVAEFFGTPIVGIGFRISIEASRMSLDMVWAEIVLAAMAGSLFYGCIVLIERATTAWHPSMRSP